MPTNHGSIEFIKFPNPQYPGDNTRLIKKWLRDSWARRKIAALTTALAEKFDIANIANNLTTTVAGYVLDARQGNVLKDAMTWKLVDSVSGNTSVSLPASFSELHVITVFTSGGTTYSYTWHILSAELDSNYKKFAAGFNNGMNNLAFLYARLSTVVLSECTFNGSGVTSNCTTSVYYR